MMMMLMYVSRGGLTGLSVVKDAPDLFSSLVIMNTGLPTGFDWGDEKTKLIQVRDVFFLVRCLLFKCV